MKTHTILLLTFILFLTSCGPAPLPALTPLTATGAATEEPTRTLMPAPPTATPRPTASPTPRSNRSAAFGMVENAVEARKSATEKYAPASLGSTFPAGGQAFTGEDGLARLDLSPDGTIIRMAPNTLFTLSSLEEIESDPFTELKLFFGQVYIILQGGELQVKTPGGVAAVRGSMLGISYTPKTNTMTATCLEGHCSLRNEAGIIELVEGQAADILQGVLAREPRPITDAELGNWLEYTPELDSLLDRLPFLRDRINRLPELPKRPRFRP
jgi:hypothetical protein